MDFTREPIIETVITPKEGCKLVVRSSKTTGQEEYFVDSIEVVSFGSAIFFRSVERPKPFIVPASDYELLEVREARIVLKNVGLDRSIKIAGGREGAVKAPREPVEEPQEKEISGIITGDAPKSEGRTERKRDRRRQYRKRRGRDETQPQDEPQSLEEKVDLPPPEKEASEAEITEASSMTGYLLTNLLSPPPLISETISRYKEKFSEAFYTKEEQDARLANEEVHITVAPLPEISLEQPTFGAFEMSEEEEEEIYRQRKRRLFVDDEEDENASADNGEKLKLEEPMIVEPSEEGQIPHLQLEEPLSPPLPKEEK